MTTRLKPRDWEILSAYLDGQLSPRENARLEARLQADDEMNNSLEQLRRTRVVLRSLPKVRSPRNYTLSASRVRVRPIIPKIYPAFRLASAMAMLLFALVVIGDFLSPGLQRLYAPQTSAKVYETQVSLLEMAPAPTQAQAIAAPLPEPTQDQSIIKSLMSDTITATVVISQASGMSPGEIEETPMGGGRLSALPSPTESAVDIYPPPATIQDTTPITTTPQIAIPVVVAQQPVPETEISPNIWRISEIILVILAVVTGLAALYIRRKVNG
jgi:hypothetical protein